jgi:hypothetical protein
MIIVRRRRTDGQTEISQENAMGWRYKCYINASIFETALLRRITPTIIVLLATVARPT